MALEAIRSQLTRGARSVHDVAERLKDGLETQRREHQLQIELDALFSDLGVEVYQRLRRGDPVVDSVVVQDIVDRIAEVEKRLEAKQQADPA